MNIFRCTSFYKARHNIRKILRLNPAGDYKLLEKTDKINISKLDPNNYGTPTNPLINSFDYVKIGKLSNKNFSREIVTFYDKSGKILQKDFLQNGEKIKRIIYGFDAFVRYKEVQIYTDKWETSYREYFSKEYNTPKYAKTYNFKKVIEHPTENFTEYKFTEIAKIGKRKFVKNIFETNLIKNNEKYILKNSKVSGDFDIDLNDEFLVYRLLNIQKNDGIIAFTRKLLKDKNLDKMKLKIIPNDKNFKNKRASGLFSASDEVIKFAEYSTFSISEMVKTIAHEVQHAYQYVQAGRIGMTNTKFQKKALKLYGKIHNKKEKIIAKKYARAIKNYPILNEKSLLTEPEYKENFLETDANAFAQKIKDKYCKNKNYNFFKQFVFDMDDWLKVKKILFDLTIIRNLNKTTNSL